MDQHKLGSAGWVAALPVGKDLVPGGQRIECEPAMCPCGSKGQPHARLHLEDCIQSWEGSTEMNAPPFCASEAVSWRTLSSQALQYNNPSGILSEMQSSERSQPPLGVGAEEASKAGI